MRNAFLKLHLVVALVAGTFLLILGATGAIMAFEEPFEVLIHPSLHRIVPGDGAPLSIATLSRIVSQKHPGEPVVGVVLPQERGRSTLVQTTRRPFFVNGYTGEVLGTLDGPGFLGFVHQVHLRLVPGLRSPVLHTVIGGSSIALFVLVLSGAVLWWRQRRTTFGAGGGAFRSAFDLHHAVGFWSGLFLLVSSLTGAVLAWDAPILKKLYASTGTQPPPRTAPSTPGEGAGAATIEPERALAIARAALPGAAPIAVSIPRDPDDSYNVRMRFPEDATPGGRSWVAIDRYSGAVLINVSSRTAPGPARGMVFLRALHTGDAFGTPSRLVMSLSSLLLVVQVLSGLVIWVKRPKARPEALRKAA